MNFFVLALKLGFVGVAFALVIQRVETAAECILECDLAGNGPPFRVPLPALTRGSTSGVHLVYVRAVITAYRGILRVGHINADIHISFPRRAGVQTGLRNFRPCHIGDFKRTFAVDIGGINNLEINVYLSAFSGCRCQSDRHPADYRTQTVSSYAAVVGRSDTFPFGDPDDFCTINPHSVLLAVRANDTHSVSGKTFNEGKLHRQLRSRPHSVFAGSQLAVGRIVAECHAVGGVIGLCQIDTRYTLRVNLEIQLVVREISAEIEGINHYTVIPRGVINISSIGGDIFQIECYSLVPCGSSHNLPGLAFFKVVLVPDFRRQFVK